MKFNGFQKNWQLIDIKSEKGFDPFLLKKAAKLRELNAQLAKERGDTLGTFGNTVNAINRAFEGVVTKDSTTVGPYGKGGTNIDLDRLFKNIMGN